MKNIKKLSSFALFLGLFIFSCLALAAAKTTTALVNVPVSNMYERADSNSPLVSQAIYYTPVTILQTKSGFAMVKTPDNYHGWIDKKELVNKSPIPNARIAKAENLFVGIYQDASVSNHQPIIIVPFSTELPLIAVTKVADEEWVKVKLVDGSTGWVMRGDVTLDPKPLNMAEMLALSRNFIGLPYIWGGVSSFGFDCSGFVQMLFDQMDVFLPRDTVVQVYWPGFTEVSSKDLRPGDILYFGWEGKVSHTGIYLGNNKFINDTVYENPIVQVSDINLPHWKEIFIVARRIDTTPPPEFHGKIEAIPEDVKREMHKYSWRQGCPVPLEKLSYLTLSYWGFDHKPHQGVLIVNSDVAQEVFDMFKEMYEDKYPIAKMQPIDRYHGDDNASMIDNNTSAFNCRAMTDFPDQYSVHSYGMAIDINPMFNPYVNNGKVEPAEGAKYQDRAVYYKGKIVPSSKVTEIFAAHGWTWGGDWPGTIKDYQHFEKLPTK